MLLAISFLSIVKDLPWQGPGKVGAIYQPLAGQFQNAG